MIEIEYKENLDEEFYKIVDELEKKLELLSAKTDLPEKVDMRKINDFVMSVNEKICMR